MLFFDIHGNLTMKSGQVFCLENYISDIFKLDTEWIGLNKMEIICDCVEILLPGIQKCFCFKYF